MVDAAHRRVKVKHPGYVVLHHIGQDRMLSVRRAAELVRHGDAEEVLSYMPEVEPILKPIMEAHARLVAQLEAEWLRCKDIPPCVLMQHIARAHFDLTSWLRGDASSRKFNVFSFDSALPDALQALRQGTANSIRAFLACKVSPKAYLQVRPAPCPASVCIYVFMFTRTVGPLQAIGVADVKVKPAKRRSRRARKGAAAADASDAAASLSSDPRFPCSARLVWHTSAAVARRWSLT